MSDAQLPRDLDDTFRLLARLGDGGMGEVFRGENRTLGNEVAIKVMLPESADNRSFRERFTREARSAARIKSAHVVEVHFFGESAAGEPFLVMELLDGITLDEALKKGPLHPWRAVGITQQICRALQAVHDEGIVHRDLKGANIMLLERDGLSDFVKLLDFGIAKRTDAEATELTASGAIIGTLSCMSPEQITGQTIDARTDVYALGVLLYRMLTGRQPFSGRDTAGMAYAHVHEPPPRPTVPGLAPALVNCVLRCMAKDPDERFASMNELAEALLDSTGVSELMENTTDAITVAFDTSMRGGPALGSRGLTGVSGVFASSGGKPEPTAQTSAGHADQSVQADALARVGAAAVERPATSVGRWRLPAIAAGLFVVAGLAGATFWLGQQTATASTPSVGQPTSVAAAEELAIDAAVEVAGGVPTPAVAAGDTNNSSPSPVASAAEPSVDAVVEEAVEEGEEAAEEGEEAAEEGEQAEATPVKATPPSNVKTKPPRRRRVTRTKPKSQTPKFKAAYKKTP